MTLAQRVRDCRYAKGWGPDELASRACISRTALYQIESGKTEQPRAGTLRRIAEALSVSTDALLGQGRGLGSASIPVTLTESPFAVSPSQENGHVEDLIRLGGSRVAATFPTGGRGVPARERELVRKLVDLLQSPLGEGVARIIEETHGLLRDRGESAL